MPPQPRPATRKPPRPQGWTELVTALIAVLAALLTAQPDGARAQGTDTGGGPLLPAAPAGIGVPFAHSGSDLVPDPAVRFGTLPNGLRYVIRANAAPAGALSVRMRVAVGAVHEQEDEQGYAHLIEHLAFNGSDAFPEGEMVRTLALLGAGFGRDVNATVSDTETLFRVDLARGGGQALDTVLLILRESASRLTFDPGALEREKGVVLSEIRVAETPARLSQERIERAVFRDDLAARRRALGDAMLVRAATPERLLAFYRTWYRPDRTALVIVGQFDPLAVEAKVRALFADWQAPPGPSPTGPDDGRWPPEPGTGRVIADAAPGRAPEVSVRVLWPDEIAGDLGDTLARRLWWQDVQLTRDLLDNRLQRTSSAPDAPFQSASVRLTRLANGWSAQISAVPDPRGWKAALDGIARTLESARTTGFSQDEVELVRQARAGQVERARRIAPRLATRDRAARLVADLSAGQVTLSEEREEALVQGALAAFSARTAGRQLEQWFDGAPAVIVLALPGPSVPGTEQVLEAWQSAREVARERERADPELPWRRPQLAFADLPPGTVVRREERTAPEAHTVVTFANGVHLAVMRAVGTPGTVQILATLGAGSLVLPAEPPGLTTLVEAAWADDGVAGLTGLDLATAVVGTGLAAGVADIGQIRSSVGAEVEARLLRRQLDILAARLNAPTMGTANARRQAGELAAGWQIGESSPRGVWQLASGSLFLRNSPRFVRQESAPDYSDATEPAILGAALVRWREALTQAPVTLAVAGDVDIEAVIRDAASTFGALPARAVRFDPGWREARRWRWRPFARTALSHAGSPDQAIYHISWRTPGDGDVRRSRQLAVLGEVLRLRIMQRLREDEGLSYSPSGGWTVVTPARDFGRLFVHVPAAPDDLPRIEALVDAIAADLTESPPSPDEVAQAVAPILAQRARDRQGNDFWVERLASIGLPDPPGLGGPDLMALDASYDADVRATTARDLHRLARRYLRPGRAWRVSINPRAKPEIRLIAAGS
jgi:zinc protease